MQIIGNGLVPLVVTLLCSLMGCPVAGSMHFTLLSDSGAYGEYFWYSTTFASGVFLSVDIMIGVVFPRCLAGPF